MHTGADALSMALRRECLERGWTVAELVERTQQAPNPPYDDIPHPRTVWRIAAGQSPRPRPTSLGPIEWAVDWEPGTADAYLKTGSPPVPNMQERMENLEEEVAYLRKQVLRLLDRGATGSGADGQPAG